MKKTYASNKTAKIQMFYMETCALLKMWIDKFIKWNHFGIKQSKS